MLIRVFTARTKWFIIVALVLATLGVYWQVNHHEFILFDDPSYITENPHVNTGLSPANIEWAFSTAHAYNWHPLTWISHMLDCQFFGLKSGSPHLVNVFLHCLNAVLLFLVFHRMTQAIWRSAFVAALFALHPLHVESVAWAAERKDVLSTLFWMLTMGAYVFYVEHPNTKRYLITLAFFALGLLAKPMLVTLPFVLLLLDYWPLGRLESSRNAEKKSAVPDAGDARKRKKKSRKRAAEETPPAGKPANFNKVWSMIRPLLREKVPFIFLSAISCVITIYAQQRIVKPLELYPFPTRLANALVSYVTYLLKMIYPVHLAVFYPYTADKLAFWQVAGAALLLIAITILSIWFLRKPYLTMGWLWYLGTLVPVIGLVQVGLQAMADRYTYIPLIGIFIMITWGIPELLHNLFYRKKLMVTVGAIVLLILSTFTYAQISYWKNDLTLFQHAVEVTTENYWAHYNLGLSLAKQKEYDRAFDHFRETIRIKPSEPDAYNNIGIILAKRGELKEAVHYFSEALRRDSGNQGARTNLGLALSQMAKKGEKLPVLDEPLASSGDAESYYLIGIEAARKGHLEEAISNFSAVLRIDPRHFKAHNNMGVALAQKGRLDEAITHFREALRINPNYKEASNNLKVALDQKKRSR
jgi:Flp pilus assembly protein TadD